MIGCAKVPFLCRSPPTPQLPPLNLTARERTQHRPAVLLDPLNSPWDRREDVWNTQWTVQWPDQEVATMLCLRRSLLLTLRVQEYHFPHDHFRRRFRNQHVGEILVWILEDEQGLTKMQCI